MSVIQVAYFSIVYWHSANTHVSNASKEHLPNYLSLLEESSQIIGKCTCFEATP